MTTISLIRKEVDLQIKVALLVLLATSMEFSYSAEKASRLVGFQNIPWYSSIEFVSKKLVGGTIVDSCISDDKEVEKELRALSKENNESCKYISIDKYIISGYKFWLSANFNSKEKLSNIRIKYVPARSLSPEEALKECGSVYDNVLSLLEIKYGDSLYVTNGTPGLRYETFEMRAWILLPTELWVRKSSGKSSKWMAECMIEINYGPRISENADKL